MNIKGRGSETNKKKNKKKTLGARDGKRARREVSLSFKEREDFKRGDCDNVSVLGIESDGDLNH